MDEITPNGSLPPGRARGFSLFELLVVMAIILVVAGFVVPAVGTMLRGTDLTRAGQSLGDTIGLARQTAVKSNRDVYVVFYQLSDSGPAAWRGMQLASVELNTSNVYVVTPLGALVVLPTAVEISEASSAQGSAATPFSPLLVQAPITGTNRLAAYGTVPYRAFRFRADGSLDRAIRPENAFVTLVSSRDKGTSPKNYYTVQVNSVTGMVRTFRP